MVVFINDSPTDFFRSHRGLWQGCPFSPLLFLLVVECLSRLLRKVVEEGSFHRLKVASTNFVTHLLFVDDVLILGGEEFKDWLNFKTILTMFCTTSCMEVNCHKSVFLAQNIGSSLKQRLITEFNIMFINPEEGMKYLGFCLKPNGYKIVDWNWLIEKFVKRINNWTFWWLSPGGRLVTPKYSCVLVQFSESSYLNYTQNPKTCGKLFMERSKQNNRFSFIQVENHCIS